MLVRSPCEREPLKWDPYWVEVELGGTEPDGRALPGPGGSVHGLIHAWTILWISMHGQLSIEAHGQLSMHGQLLSMHGQLSIELYGQLSMLWTIVHSYG